MNENNINYEVENTICNAQKLIQTSSVALAEQMDIMFVIGGKESSNTKELYNLCDEVTKTYYFSDIKDFFNFIKKEKYNLNNISKAFEKLFNAGFNTSKKIATLDIKEVRKIPNLTMSDFYIISDLWELVKKNNNKTSQLFIEFLSGYKEKGNDSK